MPRSIQAWNDDVTHPNFARYASEISVLRGCLNEADKNCNYLKKLGFIWGLAESLYWNNNFTRFDQGPIIEWIAEGARLEDKSSFGFPVWPGSTTRSFNHFHNPLKDWQQAGLNDVWTGQSLVLWAQAASSQQNIVEGDQSWQRTREYYYNALTSKTESLHQETFAKMFKGLGHQIHLLQDTAVPDHVRNDAHPGDAIFGKDYSFSSFYFETWTKERIRTLDQLRSFAPEPVFPAVLLNISRNNFAPATQLFDAETYDGLNASAGINQGLSEYTNANFFSNDTIFSAERYSSDHKHYSPFPKKSSTDLQSYIDQNKLPEIVYAEDGVPDTSFWIKKERDGESIDHFLRPSYFSANISADIDGGLYLRTFYRDDKCHEDYAKALIPRAVGYSAALIDYFFRGTLEITPPTNYIYSITDGSLNPQEFTKIKASVRNTTANEALQSGILQAVARYKVIPNYAPDLSNYPPDGTVMHDLPYSYSVSLPITLMPEQLAAMNMYPTEFTFHFYSNPIPAGITDLSLQVIFKGTLGSETDTAVAVGMKDLMEPTHHVFWNLTDMFSLDGHLYTAEDIRANPNLLARAGDAYIDPYPITMDIGYMNSSPPALPVIPAARVDSIPAGRYIRLVVLTDSQFSNNYGRLTYTDSIDTIAGISDFGFEGAVNGEVSGVWQTPTPALTHRNVKQHLYIGMLRCRPKYVDPQTGEEYCPYPEAEAIPADTTPYPAVIEFQ